MREVTSLLIFAILYTVRVAGLIRCATGGSPTPVTTEVLENKDLRNLLARLMCMDTGNGEARNFAVLTRCWSFAGDEEGFSLQRLVDASSSFSSRGPKVESLEGLGFVGLAVVSLSETSGSENRYFSTWSTSRSI